MPIIKTPGQLIPASPSTYGLEALINNNNNYSIDLANLTQAGTNITLTGAQMFTGVIRMIGSAANNYTVTLPISPRIIDALGPTIAKDGSFSVPISIQNEDSAFTATLTAGDGLTTLHGTLTVDPGTRRIWLVTIGTPYDYT